MARKLDKAQQSLVGVDLLRLLLTPPLYSTPLNSLLFRLDKAQQSLAGQAQQSLVGVDMLRLLLTPSTLLNSTQLPFVQAGQGPAEPRWTRLTEPHSCSHCAATWMAMLQKRYMTASHNRTLLDKEMKMPRALESVRTEPCQLNVEKLKTRHSVY
eukprot:gene24452-10052_t